MVVGRRWRADGFWFFIACGIIASPLLKITKGGRSAEQNHFSTATEHRLAQDFVAVGIKPGSHRIQRARILVVGGAAQVAPVAHHMDLEVVRVGGVMQRRRARA